MSWYADILSALEKCEIARVGKSTPDEEIHDSHAFGGRKGTFYLSLRLNIVHFHIRGTLSTIATLSQPSFAETDQEVKQWKRS